MINPTPVNSKSSPYSANQVRRPLPRVMAMPPIKKKRTRITWRRMFALSLLLLLAGGGTYAYAYFNGVRSEIIIEHQGDSSSILSYDPSQSLSSLSASQFKQAGDGRFNVVMVGIGGDGHPGALLTDSIQVLSIDTINKKVGITSIPRDSIPSTLRLSKNATGSSRSAMHY